MSPSIHLLHGDSITLLEAPTGLRDPATNKLLRADACIADPPYNVKLDGDREWDDFQTDRFAESNKVFMKWTSRWLRPLMRDVLHPGALVAAFSAHKTVHALMFGVEDAGFTILDVMLWLYATGQVKHKQKLKPAYEPIVIARRKSPQGDSEKQINDLFKKTGRGHMNVQAIKDEDGRHPLNIEIADERVIECDEDVRDMAKILYVAKPSVKDRDYGCDDLPVVKRESELSGISTRCEACEAKQKNVSPKVLKEPCPACGKGPLVYAGGVSAGSGEGRNFHPTVKPIALMRRMVRMLTRPGATIIDPFMGSGTTGIACVLEGRNFIGIEREEDFFNLCKARISGALRETGETEAADKMIEGVVLKNLVKEGNLGASLSLRCPNNCHGSGYMKGARTCNSCGSALFHLLPEEAA